MAAFRLLNLCHGQFSPSGFVVHDGLSETVLSGGESSSYNVDVNPGSPNAGEGIGKSSFRCGDPLCLTVEHP
jgi:hypothetical protein